MQSFARKEIKKDEWGKRLNDVKIRKEEMNKLIMNFLVTEDYVEAAEKFQLELVTKPDLDLGTTTNRVAVHTTIQSGNVEAVIEKDNDLNPEVSFLQFIL
ncbi:hypothetical protein SUGI_1089540 [Cryptomeria japonica]|nr:hypothetical protein SUGI_1089540 [Cryptomeria japonica]